MIREAGEADIPALVELGRRSVARGGLPCGFDAGTMEQTLRFLLDSPDGFIFVTDKVDGAVGGLAHPHPFNAAHKTYAMKMELPLQRVTPEMVDQYMLGVERAKARGLLD